DLYGKQLHVFKHNILQLHVHTVKSYLVGRVILIGVSPFKAACLPATINSFVKRYGSADYGGQIAGKMLVDIFIVYQLKGVCCISRECSNSAYQHQEIMLIALV